MFGSSLIASMFTAAVLAQGANTPVNPGWTLKVSTPTYGTDGKVTGASADFGQLALNKPLVLYAYSGKSLCESASAMTSVPADAGNGWRVQVTPLRTAGNTLVMQVDWERMWERGAKVNGPRGKAQMTFRAGDRIIFDYITVGE